MVTKTEQKKTLSKQVFSGVIWVRRLKVINVEK